MRQISLLIIACFLTFGLQAQNAPVLPTIEGVISHLRTIKSNGAATLREEISCTRETEFNWNTTTTKWDSLYQTITKVDETDGKINIEISTSEYDAVDGFVATEVIKGYGIVGFVDFEDEPTSFDSLLFFGPDQFTGDLILIARILPTYNAKGKIVKQDTYFNTAFFGFPLGIVLFGVNLYYYDANDYLIAEASKAYDLGTFALENGDSIQYTNNAAGQILVEQTWSWNTDVMDYDNTSRTTNSYIMMGGDVATVTYESWDENTMGFVYNSQSAFSYVKPGLVLKEEIKTGSPGNWLTVQEISYTYDAQDRVTLTSYKSVNPNGVKTDTNRENVKWDTPQGWTSESIFQTFVGGNWVNNDRSILEPCSPISSVKPPLASETFLNAWFDACRQLNLTFAVGTQPRTLDLYDIQGRLSLRADLTNGQNKIDGSALLAGMYLARVTYADGRVAAKQVQKF